MSRLFHRTGKIVAARGITSSSGFIASNPQFFDEQPNATIIEDLRFSFSIEKSLDRDPNKCEVKIYNLSPTARVELTTRPLKVVLMAGYDGHARYLFQGDLRFGHSQHSESDWETTLQLGDGDRAYRHAQVHKSYRRGTSVMVALRDVVGSMGLKLDNRLNLSSQLQAGFAAGRSLSGRAADELTTLLETYGYTWSIQDGRMQILSDSDVREGEVRVIDESTGMIGSPEYQVPDVSYKKNGELSKATSKGPKLQVRTLLYPELTPGAKVKVDSAAVTGLFRIERVTHNGDTYDGDWVTEIEAKPL